jgi:eukaryotic-like serine/threonine-protein kinase
MADAPTPVGLPVFSEPENGDLIGRYRVNKLLGEGGMARVYEVKHLDHGHKAALKLPKLGLDEQFRERFLLEAGAHLNLNGRLHILNPLETGVLPAPDCRPFLVMQLVAGKTLEAFMCEAPPSPFREGSNARLFRSIRFMIQIAMALDNAHSLRPPIVHRDLKPSNVYVTKAYVQIEGKDVEYVLLGDFGLAWRRGDDLTAVGTPGYCSPEQAVNEPPTTRSDFYSLGVMLFELIEGKLPFEHPDTRELLVMHRSLTPPLLTNAVGREHFQPLVSKLLAKEAAQRPRDAAEIITALSVALLKAEERDKGTEVGRVPGFGVPPTQKLPLPAGIAPKNLSEKASNDLIHGVRPAPFAHAPRWIGVLLLLSIVVWVAVKLVPEDNVGATPQPTAPVAEVSPAPQTAASIAAPVAAPVDDLAPLKPAHVEPKVVAPKTVEPKLIEPKIACEVSPEWKKMMLGNLAALEARANALPALTLETELEAVGRSVSQAETPGDCTRANKQFEALRKRAVK